MNGPEVQVRSVSASIEMADPHERTFSRILSVGVSRRSRPSGAVTSRFESAIWRSPEHKRVRRPQFSLPALTLAIAICVSSVTMSSGL